MKINAGRAKRKVPKVRRVIGQVLMWVMEGQMSERDALLGLKMHKLIAQEAATNRAIEAACFHLEKSTDSV